MYFVSLSSPHIPCHFCDLIFSEKYMARWHAHHTHIRASQKGRNAFVYAQHGASIRHNNLRQHSKITSIQTQVGGPRFANNRKLVLNWSTPLLRHRRVIDPSSPPPESGVPPLHPGRPPIVGSRQAVVDGPHSVDRAGRPPSSSTCHMVAALPADPSGTPAGDCKTNRPAPQTLAEHGVDTPGKSDANNLRVEVFTSRRIQ